MDALAAYGSDDDDSDSDHNEKTKTDTTTTGTLLGGYGSSDSGDSGNDNDTEKNKVALSTHQLVGVKRKAPPSASDDTERYVLTETGLSSDLFSMTAAATENNNNNNSPLARLHQRVRTVVRNPKSSSTTKRRQPTEPPKGYSCFADCLDQTKSHEFHNPLFREKLQQELDISSLSSSSNTNSYSIVDQPFFDWEPRVLALEEEARVRQFQQQQQSNHPAALSQEASALAQQLLSRALAMKSKQGD